MDNYTLRDWLEPPEQTPPGWFQKRGRVFEAILNQMFLRDRLESRINMRPQGEEIDGSFEIGESFYLLEAKWHASPIPASSLYAFKGKVDGKLIGTVGVFFSMSDYSTEAVDALLSGKELNLILFGHEDLILIEEEKITFREAMRVKRRYASNYGQPFYPLKTHLSETQQPSLDTNVQLKGAPWSILVESESDQRAIKLLLERYGINSNFSVIAAGGQLAVAQLAEHLKNNDQTNLAAIVTPISDADLEQDQLLKLSSIGVEIVKLKTDIEQWLDQYVSTEYHNAVFILSERNGRLARRYAQNADIAKLRSENLEFSNLLLKLNGT